MHVLQKLLEHGTDFQRKELCSALKGQVASALIHVRVGESCM